MFYIKYQIYQRKININHVLSQIYNDSGEMERLENGEWSYSTPRVFQEFQQKFPDFQGTYQKPAQRVYKCVNVFWKQVVFCAKKAVEDRQKKTAEKIEEVE
jgi:predicted chitinase